MANDKTTTKTPQCSLSRKQFNHGAQPLVAEIAGVPVELEVRHFSTGGFGWYFGGKVTVKLSTGRLVTCQVGLNAVVVNSKFAVNSVHDDEQPTAPAQIEGPAAGETAAFAEETPAVVG